ncbi:ABC transporter ATP-binding protein [Lysinibacillus pakistanensis]|uniref:ATP-binding cassette domain-containing protein n=1 Tax=Lysinibacillus pakistanensis TaxID=759811 RepID=A0ABX6DE96_9BACI|nr:ATP-binding cassette domain-containing protein [Lysinibacillus pakistanensis]
MNKYNFTWKRVLKLVNKKWILFVILLTVLINAAIAPLSPVIVMELIDNGFSGNGEYSFFSLVLMLLGIGILQIFVIGSQSLAMISLTSTITKNVRENLHSKLQEQPISFFTETKMGEMIARLNEEANSIGDTAIKPFVYTLQTILSLLATIVVMYSLNWKLTTIILLIIPILFIPLPFIGKFAYKFSKKLVESITELNNYIHKNLNINGVLLNKIYGRRKEINQEFYEQITAVKDLTMKQSYVAIGYDNFFMLATTLAPLLVYWFGRPGGALEITAGTAIAFTGYIASLFNPIQQIGQLSITLQQSKYVFERFFEYIDLPSYESDEDGIKNMQGNKILINNVCFSYEEGTPTLKNISIEINEKEKVGIVGPSGSGKTTLGYLLARLYLPDSGNISIGSININNYDTNYYHKNVGMIVQEPYILNASIWENLKIANKEATENEIITATKNTFIHDKIMSLPEGYNTVVGERGYKLSGGEKQRLAIARVFLQNPKVIILDEATSALDTKTEHFLQAALTKLTKDRTVITIAHRITTLKDCDTIYVLKDGEIVERGKYETLLTDKESEFNKIYA